eukprot:TRINITY_DN1276_c1_g1_i1.p1 TRINITY_DN1276_c1_g1~~TRINITY_DN1276_c1_g1_i1.p1  ORF type:complete len:78 (-),score=8.12 TRINITY_DN1276_c1_g1_i1:123-356(-)
MSDSDDDYLPSDHGEEEITPNGRRPSVGNSDDEGSVSTTMSTVSEASDVSRTSTGVRKQRAVCQREIPRKNSEELVC